ncbi:MAG: hypothetical protein HRU20_03225 [Pseudomonadales bacterium]|nr:hypothetical protein [Pseudomonadales bacterium]
MTYAHLLLAVFVFSSGSVYSNTINIKCINDIGYLTLSPSSQATNNRVNQLKIHANSNKKTEQLRLELLKDNILIQSQNVYTCGDYAIRLNPNLHLSYKNQKILTNLPLAMEMKKTQSISLKNIHANNNRLSLNFSVSQQGHVERKKIWGNPDAFTQITAKTILLSPQNTHLH